jgi:DNA-binding transcriptional regulator/RsmH inhibitor MraZ
MGNFLEKIQKGDGISKIVETNLNPDRWFMLFKKSIESILLENNKLKISEADRAARRSLIRELEGKLQYVQSDSEARLSLIHELEGKLQCVQSDSEARLSLIHELEGKLQYVQSDSEARLSLIHELEEKLQGLEKKLLLIEVTPIYRFLQKIGFFHFKAG